jgi:nitrile hydratase
MNGVHDMGGMQCFGPLAAESNPHSLHEHHLFEHDWERDVLALTLAMGATGVWNLDQSRAARESLPPGDYLSIGYYRIWLRALERLLLEHRLVTAAELEAGLPSTPPASVKQVLSVGKVTAVLRMGAPVNRQVDHAPAFAPGERVRIGNRHSPSHTRLPAYIRNHSGYVHRIHGVHVYPDSHGSGLGEQPQWLYNVRFSAAELWGEQQAQHSDVHVDCWEPYLAPLTPEP